MSKKLIWRVLKISFAAIALLVFSLTIHIYMVTQPSRNSDGPLKQMARIDFRQTPMDSTTAKQAVEAIEEIPEVLSHFLNEKTGALVYTVEAGDNRAQLAFEAFMEKGDFDAVRYLPTEESLAKSCPAINKSSLTYRLGKFFQDLFS